MLLRNSIRDTWQCWTFARRRIYVLSRTISRAHTRTHAQCHIDRVSAPSWDNVCGDPWCARMELIIVRAFPMRLGRGKISRAACKKKFIWYSIYIHFFSVGLMIDGSSMTWSTIVRLFHPVVDLCFYWTGLHISLYKRITCALLERKRYCRERRRLFSCVKSVNVAGTRSDQRALHRSGIM